jgi:hypothetical protein
VELLVDCDRELDKSVGPWPHPFEAIGAYVEGKQRVAEARFSGLRRRKVPCLLLSELVQGIMVWHLWLIPSCVQITQES